MPVPDSEWPQANGTKSADQEEALHSSTPLHPSYSPVTPTIQPSVLASSQRQQPAWMGQPQAEPVSLEDNPDAIAMRAAISILQIQRQQSLRDIQNLDKIKAAALENPSAFLEELKAGKLSKRSRSGDDADGREEAEANVNGNVSDHGAFGTLPEAQNIVRSPPINWNKYHVVGDSLDKLHEEQRRRPDSGQHQQEDLDERRPEHAIAAPYRPFVDKLDPASARDRKPNKIDR